MVFINVLIVGAAPPFVFLCCLNTPADFRLSGVPGARKDRASPHNGQLHPSCTHTKIPTPPLHPQTCMWDRRIFFPCFCRCDRIVCTGTCTISVHPSQGSRDRQSNTYRITSHTTILLLPEKHDPSAIACPWNGDFYQ